MSSTSTSATSRIPAHPEVLVEAFEQLLQAGKIRSYGVSTDDPAVLRAL